MKSTKMNELGKNTNENLSPTDFMSFCVSLGDFALSFSCHILIEESCVFFLRSFVVCKTNHTLISLAVAQNFWLHYVLFEVICVCMCAVLCCALLFVSWLLMRLAKLVASTSNAFGSFFVSVAFFFLSFNIVCLFFNLIN